MAKLSSYGDADPELTAVEVAGFKSAASPVRVNFRNITILAGANSAGKSTVMQPLLLIKQTLEKPFDPGGLAIDGPLVKFTHADQFFSHTRSKNLRPIFSTTLEQKGRDTRLVYGRLETGEMDIQEMSFSIGGKKHVWTDRKIIENDDPIWMDKEISDKFRIFENLLTGPKQVFEFHVYRDRVALAVGFARRDAINPIILAPWLTPAETAINQIHNMIYLPGLRGNPERHYAISAAGPQYPGSFNDYVASIIHRWGAAADDRLGQLGSNLKLLGLTGRITTRTVDDTRVEVRVGRLPAAVKGGARDTVNIADVGFGVSQTLPVLVAFLTAAPGQIVYVEQPELHLHPRAQVALAEIILQAADRGVRVVIETHSSLLILALQAAIAEGKIDPGQVSLNWFTRDNTGQTIVAEAQMEDDGSYGNWPIDFDLIELDLQNRYMTLVDRRRAQT